MSGPAETSGAAANGASEDLLLCGRLRLRQPASGYRVAIDPIFLAAAVPAGPADAILDVGSGVGAASLCLAARVPGCRITGVEMQRDLVRLAGDNIVLNDLTARLSVMRGDLLALPPRLAPGAFDHVMANPPFLAAGSATAPGDAGKAAANLEGEANLAAWVRVALAMVRARGSLTFIHRADRLDALLALLVGKAGEITLYPLWPGEGKPAKRIIVRARKGIASPTRLLPGMVLHEADGRYTAAADSVLRDAAALEM
jgi:tRNA1(Val) A37 N6-methylase TrmN6